MSGNNNKSAFLFAHCISKNVQLKKKINIFSHKKSLRGKIIFCMVCEKRIFDIMKKADS